MSFENNTKVRVVHSGEHSFTDFVILDGPVAQRTVRASADGVHGLTIAHQLSKENGRFPTQRSTVRFLQTIPVEESDETVEAYAQLTTSFPKGQCTVVQAQMLTARLINFLTKGGVAPDEADATASATLSGVTRLYAGEP